MLINSQIIKKRYRCNRIIANYLIYKCHLPVIGYDEKYYYFAYSNWLEECLENMPLGLKLLSIFEGRRLI